MLTIPAAGRTELRQEGVRDVEHAVEVDTQHLLPVLDDRLRIPGDGVAPVDAGIIDQDRDRTDLLVDERSNLAAAVALGHIEHQIFGLAAGFPDCRNGLRRSIAVDVEDDDAGALPRIAERDRPPDA